MTVSVLVVDDDESFREVVARMLRCWGHEVAEAEGFADALARSTALRPDAVLVDVGLPDGDGLQLAQRIAAMSWGPRVVIVSSDAEVTDDAGARDLGAVAFLPKETLADGGLREVIEA